MPQGLASAFLEPVKDPIGDLVSRYARTHGPFRSHDAAARFGLATSTIDTTLRRLEAAGRVVSGAFLRGGSGSPEWCEVNVLRRLKRRALARLREEVEPVDTAALGRLFLEWQGVIEQLQGLPLVASTLESAVLPVRVVDYEPALLDELCASGEIVWRGVEPIGARDGRVAFYLRDHYPRLAPAPPDPEGELARTTCEFLSERGASFFQAMVKDLRSFSREFLDVFWDLVWSGVVTNDSIAPLRSFLRGATNERRRGRSVRRTRLGPPGSEGRWSLLPAAGALDSSSTETERCTAIVQVLLERYGVLTREAVRAEGIDGGFSSVYPFLKAMEEAGRIRRGYFVAGLGATQFAVPGAEDRLRGFRQPSEDPKAVVLSATDPAAPYGSVIPWPVREGERLERRAGARVVLVDGDLVAFLGRSERNLVTFLADDDETRRRQSEGLAGALANLVESGSRRALLLAEIDGNDPAASSLEPYLEAAGFRPGSSGYLMSNQRASRWDSRSES